MARHGPSGAGPARRNSGRDGRACQDAADSQPGAGLSIRRQRGEVKPASAALRRPSQPSAAGRVPGDGRRRLHSRASSRPPVSSDARRGKTWPVDRRIRAKNVAHPCLRAGLVPVDRHGRGGVCAVDGAAHRRSVARRGRPAAEHRHQPRAGRARLSLDCHAQGPRPLRRRAVRARHASRRHGPREPAPDRGPARWRRRRCGSAPTGPASCASPGDAVTRYGAAEGVPDDIVWDLYQDRQRRVWLASSRGARGLRRTAMASAALACRPGRATA